MIITVAIQIFPLNLQRPQSFSKLDEKVLKVLIIKKFSLVFVLYTENEIQAVLVHHFNTLYGSIQF